MVEDSPSLRHILPISLLSLVKLMTVGSCKSVKDVHEDAILEFGRDELYHALESVTAVCLEPEHCCSGIVAGGDGRPVFPSSSVFGRDGEIAKIAVPDTALATLMNIGARMRKSAVGSTEVETETIGTNKFRMDSLLPFLLDAMVQRRGEAREYESAMEEPEDFFRSTPDDGLVPKKHMTTFLTIYETLLRYNRASTVGFRGPGVRFRSNHVPDVVRFW